MTCGQAEVSILERHPSDGREVMQHFCYLFPWLVTHCSQCVPYCSLQFFPASVSSCCVLVFFALFGGSKYLCMFEKSPAEWMRMFSLSGSSFVMEGLLVLLDFSTLRSTVKQAGACHGWQTFALVSDLTYQFKGSILLCAGFWVGTIGLLREINLWPLFPPPPISNKLGFVLTVLSLPKARRKCQPLGFLLPEVLCCTLRVQVGGNV